MFAPSVDEMCIAVIESIKTDGIDRAARRAWTIVDVAVVGHCAARAGIAARMPDAAGRFNARPWESFTPEERRAIGEMAGKICDNQCRAPDSLHLLRMQYKALSLLALAPGVA